MFNVLHTFFHLEHKQRWSWVCSLKMATINLTALHFPWPLTPSPFSISALCVASAHVRFLFLSLAFYLPLGALPWSWGASPLLWRRSTFAQRPRRLLCSFLCTLWLCVSSQSTFDLPIARFAFAFGRGLRFLSLLHALLLPFRAWSKRSNAQERFKAKHKLQKLKPMEA